MDTGTVLEIIKMIDNRISNLITEYYNEGNLSDSEYHYRITEIADLQNHLQNFIEAQVNAIENQGSE